MDLASMRCCNHGVDVTNDLCSLFSRRSHHCVLAHATPSVHAHHLHKTKVHVFDRTDSQRTRQATQTENSLKQLSIL